MMKRTLFHGAAAAALLWLGAAGAAAQEPYRSPGADIEALLDAPSPPSLDFSPDARWILEEESPELPAIADVARPMLRLAGMRLDPATHARFQTRFGRSLVLRDLEGTTRTEVPLPEGGRISGASWCHDSRRFAFTLGFADRTELWVAEVAAPAQPRRVSARLNAALGSGFAWLPDGQGMILLEVPEGRGPAPEPPRAPAGPVVMETSGRKSPLRTYQDLLQSPHDEALFVHYCTSALVRLDLASGRRTLLGEPDLWSRPDPSPGGGHLMVTLIRPPFSYVMPVFDFAHTVLVIDLDGGARRVFAEVPLAEGIPIEGVRLGPRSISWVPDGGATLCFVEALDGGDPRNTAEHRDRWLTSAWPFDGEPVELVRVKGRARGLDWTRGALGVFAGEYDRDRRWTTTTYHDLTMPERTGVVVEDRSIRDRYGDPGRLLSERDAAGQAVVRQAGPHVFRSGSGATREGALPFLDRQDLTTLATERLWRCEKGAYETLAALVRVEPGRKPVIVTRRETPVEPANHFLVDLERADAARPITANVDPTPQIRGIAKRLVTYERDDGVKLSATLYLPADHQEGTRLPLMVWAYPLEYSDADTAGQVGGSPWRFTRLGGASHLFLLTRGYAVMDDATMPVIGDPETMNDTFISQIVASARAAIDFAVAEGVADRDRVAVGGHSYGAFMTANLLAHSDLFRAGVARSGAYNRTLTPFGFQSERRTLWEAPEVYERLSPFMHADKIDEPLLLIHGEADNNSGTFPIQSERLFAALQGNGGAARLVMLPHESHGYQARESVLHTLAESFDWLDRHVKAAPPRQPE